MIPFDEIDKRLDALGKDRAWLAAESRRSPHSIRAALAPNAMPKSRAKLLQIALSEAIEREEANQRKGAVLPDRITLEVPPTDFEAFNAAALAKGLTLKRWAVAALNEAAAQAKVVAFGSRQDWQKGDGAARVADTDEEPSGPARIEERQNVPRNWIDGRGAIAAGQPIDAVDWAPLPTEKQYPEDHYALTVSGDSMAPKIPDGSVIVVREWREQGFPKKGTIVVYSDGSGSTLKEFGYRKAREDEDANSFGMVPVLKSLNPAFPEVQTMEGGRLDAVFVEVL